MQPELALQKHLTSANRACSLYKLAEKWYRHTAGQTWSMTQEGAQQTHTFEPGEAVGFLLLQLGGGLSG